MDGRNKDLRSKDFLSVVMSEGDLKGLGMGDVAYIKSYDVKGKLAYVLHAADGTTIEVEDNENDAILSAYHNDLNIVAVH